jgi:hypothetical protein
VLWIVDGGEFGLAGALVTYLMVWIAGVYCGHRASVVVDGP